MQRILPLFAVLVVVLLAPAAAQAPDPSGEWIGQIEVPGSPLGIEVLLTRSNGDWSGTIAIPVQNLRDYPLSDVEVEGRQVGFMMADIPGDPTFVGTLSEDGHRIEGPFLQGGMEITFYLERADAAREESAEAARRSLDGFGDLVTAAMDSLGVPGASVAIVRGNEIIFLQGFGRRDVEAGLPVTPQTQFAIGSSTKAFTAAALATLVDEGLITWSTPVVEALPSFRLADPTATAEMNAVDLLTHRSGLPRHDLAWYATGFDRQDLFRRLRHFEPTESFRAVWQYQNLMYLAAGVLTEELTGTSWEEAVRQRLLLPLGMTEANFSVERMQQQGDYARPYGGSRDTVEVMEFKSLDHIGPAGSINASAEEMARWIMFQLGDGTVNGQPILESSTLRFTHAPQMIVAGQRASQDTPYLMYALGWMVEPYRGRRMIHHGGNIDGFSALVGFMPDDDIGVVILTNKNATPLNRVIMMNAFDRLLDFERRDWLQEVMATGPQSGDEDGDDHRIEGTTPSRPLAAFAGTYEHPGYGQVRITGTDEGLHLEYYTVTGALSHVHYDTFEFDAEAYGVSLRVTFVADAQGRIARLEVPLEMTSEAIAFERHADEALLNRDYLAEFVGTYRGSGLTFTVAMRGDRTLTLTVGGQGTWELRPTREDAFDVDGLSGFSVRFEREDDGVVRLIGIQPGGSVRADRTET